MDEEELLGNSSDDENTIQETLQRDTPATFSKHLVNHFGIIAHHNVSSETVNPPDNQIAVFVDFLKPLVVCLDNINSNNGREWNRESRADAYSLLLALQKFSFVLSLVVAREILAITKPLNVQLQGSYSDIATAHCDVDLVKRQVKTNCNDLNKFHSLVYNKACSVARDIGVEEDVLRTTSRQQYRSNPSHETPKDYYQLVITAPMLHHLHSQLAS